MDKEGKNSVGSGIETGVKIFTFIVGGLTIFSIIFFTGAILGFWPLL